MADQLLIRAYNVELGDCIYCRIPKARKSDRKDFHMLIDCGSWGSLTTLKAAIADLEQLLPKTAGGKRRLDLLVVTHEHKDHIAGFDPDTFKNIVAENIWMSTAMNSEHPQAVGARRLHTLAATAMRNIAARNLALSPELNQLVDLFGIGNDGALDTLRTTLPAKAGIEPKYVHAGQTAEELGVELNGATIRILAPEENIDFYYLGDDTAASFQSLASAAGEFRQAPDTPVANPTNVSQSDFRKLQSRMLSGAFAFANMSGKVTNNTSVVLLIEWKRKRLLFVGDAEWDNKFKEGKSNGSWNVMWNKRKDWLDAPVHFLKVGHHGSENATPWNDKEDGEETEPSQILDAILPLPTGNARPKAVAVVSTLRKNYKTIPRSALLTEIGQRVKGARTYGAEFTDAGIRTSELNLFSEYEKTWFAKAQPLRTDCEKLLSGKDYVEIKLAAE